MRLTMSTSPGVPRRILIRSLRAPNQPSYPLNRRPNICWSLISRLQKRLGLQFRQRCLRAPTKSSNRWRCPLLAQSGHSCCIAHFRFPSPHSLDLTRHSHVPPRCGKVIASLHKTEKCRGTLGGVLEEEIMLTLSKARKIVDHALERAKGLNISVSVAVCDPSGRLIALNQMDGSVGWETDRSSIGKAVAAAITGRPSDRLFEEFDRGAVRIPTYNNVFPPR